jgi:hypothetical protein
VNGSREHNNLPGDRGQGIGGDEERESRLRGRLSWRSFCFIDQTAERPAPEGCRLLRRIEIPRSGFFILGNPNSLSPKKKREHNDAWRQRQHDTKKDRLNCAHRRPPGFDSANQPSHPQRASLVFLVSIETRRNGVVDRAGVVLYKVFRQRGVQPEPAALPSVALKPQQHANRPAREH